MVGLTEVEPAPVEGMSLCKLDCLRTFETRREQESGSKLARAKRHRSIERRETTTLLQTSNFVPEPPIESGIVDNEVEIILIHHNGDGEELNRFIVDKRLKREIDFLLKRSRKFKSKKTLFFIFEARTSEVVFEIIRNNVQPKKQLLPMNGRGTLG